DHAHCPADWLSPAGCSAKRNTLELYEGRHQQCEAPPIAPVGAALASCPGSASSTRRSTPSPTAANEGKLLRSPGRRGRRTLHRTVVRSYPWPRQVHSDRHTKRESARDLGNERDRTLDYEAVSFERSIRLHDARKRP